MRISDLSAAVAVLLLAGCSSETAPDPVASAPDSERIECALAGASGFTRDCSIEQVGDDGGELVLHHRDGGFRRLRVVDGGRRLAAADGAEQPGMSRMGDGSIELTIGEDRYHLPAAAAR